MARQLPMLINGEFVASQTDRDALAQVRRDVAQLCKEYRFAHTTVEIEWGEDECRMGIG